MMSEDRETKSPNKYFYLYTMYRARLDEKPKFDGAFEWVLGGHEASVTMSQCPRTQ